MADFSKAKTKKKPANRFNISTDDTKASDNLTAPEVAPAEAKTKRTQKARSKTGRTEPFGTRVSKEFIKDFNEVAYKSGLKKVELLEDMLEVYRSKKRL